MTSMAGAHINWNLHGSSIVVRVDAHIWKDQLAVRVRHLRAGRPCARRTVDIREAALVHVGERDAAAHA